MSLPGMSLNLNVRRVLESWLNYLGEEKAQDLHDRAAEFLFKSKLQNSYEYSQDLFDFDFIVMLSALDTDYRLYFTKTRYQTCLTLQISQVHSDDTTIIVPSQEIELPAHECFVVASFDFATDQAIALYSECCDKRLESLEIFSQSGIATSYTEPPRVHLTFRRTSISKEMLRSLTNVQLTEYDYD